MIVKIQNNFFSSENVRLIKDTDNSDNTIISFFTDGLYNCCRIKDMTPEEIRKEINKQIGDAGCK